MSFFTNNIANHTSTCNVFMDKLTNSVIILITWLSRDSEDCYFIYLKKGKLKGISTICGNSRKDLTLCDDTSTICVHLSPEIA